MGLFDGFRVGFAEKAALQRELDIEKLQSEYYREAYSDSARAMLGAEDLGWAKIGNVGDLTQITLVEAKEVSRRLHGYMESNPLLTRGREVRASYLFSSAYQIGIEGAEASLTPQQKNIINRQKNQDAVFSMEALERIEAERYSAGQAFVLYNRQTKNFQHLSFQEIGDIIYNPDDSSEVWYVRRDWSSVIIRADGSTGQVNNKYYYPASTFDGGEAGYAQYINNIQVDDTKRMIVDRVNVQPGGNLGIPDSFAAAPWALAYSAYLSDGSKVLAALAEWAWLVKPKKKNPAERAAATVRNERGAGGTLFTDMDVQAMPTSNAVDLNTGRPLAAQVASSLGISIVLLLADPGQSGAYGTAQTLSDPNRRTMEARRERNTAFLRHCLTLLGIESPTIKWPKMSPGSDDEESDIVMKAWGSGMYDVDEIRPRLAELAHIELKHENAPEGILLPNNVNSWARADIDPKEDPTKPVATDGSTKMTNSQGRDNLGIGNLSHKPATPAADRKD